MHWIVGNRIGARPTAAKVSGASALAGAIVEISVDLALVEWPHFEAHGPAKFVPQAARLMLQRPAPVNLGWCIPEPGAAIQLMKHSTEEHLRYYLPISFVELARLEGLRNGRPLGFELSMPALVYIGGALQNTTTFALKLEVGRERWSEVLESVSFRRVLITELELPEPSAGSPGTGKALGLLGDAIVAREDGRNSDAVAKCRLAVDALGQAGFGGRAPADVIAFIKQNGKRLTMEERFSVLQAALHLYCSPAHHVAPEADLSRHDATLALGTTAALIGAAPSRHQGDLAASVPDQRPASPVAAKATGAPSRKASARPRSEATRPQEKRGKGKKPGD